MSYSMITAILLSVIALSLSDSIPNLEENVIGRFYSNFGQLYRPTVAKRCPTYIDINDNRQCYEYSFTEREYSSIAPESLTMVFTNVSERSITYHSSPNFEKLGSRYLYRPDPKQNRYAEIELVNAEDRLFRTRQRPTEYFYLDSYDNLFYLSGKPISPYYNVSFICDSVSQTDNQRQLPALTYIDKNYRWTPRYLVDSSIVDNRQYSIMYAYADLHNSGSGKILLKSAEFISGYLRYETSLSDLRATIADDATDDNNDDVRGSYVYKVPLQSPVELLPYSTKSIQFIQPEITVTPFRYYKSEFSTLNSTSKLAIAYNLTSVNDFLPSGVLLFREQGRFIGESLLPDITRGETLTMIFGYDAAVFYNRIVKIVDGSESGRSTKYSITYSFQNLNSESVRLYFVESFLSYKNYEISDISTSQDEKNQPELVNDGEYLRGYITIPAGQREKIVSYTILTRKN